MTRILPPADLTATEKRAFRRLCSSLIARGIDPGSRGALIEDFCRLDARLAAIRASEATAGSAKLATTRALNVATAERRRLHSEIYKGARPVPRPPSVDREKFSDISPEERARRWPGWALALGDRL